MPVPFRAHTLILLAWLVTAASCSSPDGAEKGQRAPDSTVAAAPASRSTTGSDLSPAETVTRMLQAYLAKRLGEYYHFVASSEKQFKSLEELQRDFAPSSSDLVTDFLFSSTKFKVDSVDIRSDSAFVFITARAPPVGFAMEQATILERDLGSSVELGMKLSILGERYKMAGAPVREQATVYPLVKEEKGWRVVVGWSEQDEQRGPNVETKASD